MKRSCGVLLPVASLPSKYGIGCFSTEAYRFVDFLVKAGQSYWQILPLGQTGYGDSPYQSFSTFAGNPYFIDLEQLIGAGYLSREETEQFDFGSNPSYIEYDLIYMSRYLLLHHAYENSPYSLHPSDVWKQSAYNRDRYAFETFITNNKEWLEDYALYSALKGRFENAAWTEWDDDIRLRKPEALEAARKRHADEIRYQEFVQYEFAAEWKELKAYANANGIRIIGDIPIYVSSDSSDFWTNPDLFQVDEKGFPTAVAGVPADGFSATGQLWGNPLYRWDYEKARGYKWWMRRIGKCRTMMDVVRIDHFRGFDEYFSIKAGEPNALNGHWEKGPGIDLFKAAKAEYPDLEIIAEDLGYVTDSVKQLVRDTGFPNMKIIEFAFDSRDSSGAVNYLPYNYGKNHVVYTGTHDNETLVGWLGSILPEERQAVKDYLGTDSDDRQVLAAGLIRIAQSSTANLCVIPMQDYLGLDNSARINHPSTFGSNWKWRMDADALTDALKERILKLTKTYGRMK